ncbi:MAG: glycolate oxidase subunit GlcE [Alphaproteobacteria bacterium]|nr:glycolate oxidase subunit GlcE [Alphaproteobacteria bacterium]
MSQLKPADAAQLREMVAAAAAGAQPLEIVGGGSKRALGRPVQAAHTLDLSALTAIVDYEAAELVLTARAATPLAEIEAALAAKSQMLAFEPPDWGRLLGTSAGQTIGGVLSCNLAGPRRFKAGAARDHLLGFAGVNGRGEAFKAGGKVVKNVTGYDLCKLMAGAHGTLAVLSELTIKVLPRPEKTRTVLIHGLDEARAVAAMTAALNAPHEVSGAAHLPAGLARRSSVGYVAGAGGAVTALRVEGPGPSVVHRCEALRRELAEYGSCEELHSKNSARFWREIRDVEPFAGDAARIVWRVSLPPSEAPAVLRRIAQSCAAEHFIDWGGGLLWLAVAPERGAREDGGAAIVRAAVGGTGHTTMIRAPDALRTVVPVFEPPAPALAALSARVKESFDPLRILNPGRLHRGI